MNEFDECKKNALNMINGRYSYLRKYFIDSPELDDVAAAIYNADRNFDGRGDIRGYRREMAHFSISEGVRKIYKEKNLPVIQLGNYDCAHKRERDVFIQKEESEHRAKQVKFLINNSGLTSTQKNCIMLKYFDNQTFDNIGKSMGFTKQRAYQLINKAIKKMKVTAGVLKSDTST